ncbi:MAG: hypothetical protein JNG84_06550 [Archangium sp.]|nr:hypothetical protein [Archangium sp.]
MMRMRSIGFAGVLACAACFDFSLDEFCRNNPTHPQCSGDGGALGGGAGGGGAMGGGTGGGDGGSTDAGRTDGGASDSGTPADSGVFDAGSFDAGTFDAGLIDAGQPDAGDDDAGLIDAGSSDAGAFDAGTLDAGMMGCDSDGGYSDSNAWFVSITGNDGNPGTMASPFASLTQALSTARNSVTKKRIVLDEAIYNHAGIVLDAGWNGVSIEGAGLRTGIPWTRNCNLDRRGNTRIDVSGAIGLTISGGAFKLQDLELLAGNASSAAAPNTYGIYGTDVLLELNNVRVKSGVPFAGTTPSQPGQTVGLTSCNNTPSTGADGGQGDGGAPSDGGFPTQAGYQTGLGGTGVTGVSGSAGTAGGAPSPATATCLDCNCANCSAVSATETGPVGRPGCGGVGGTGGSGATGGGASIAVFLSGASRITVFPSSSLEASAGAPGGNGGPGGLGATGATGQSGGGWCYTSGSICSGSGGSCLGCAYNPSGSTTRAGGAAGGKGGNGGLGGVGGAGAGGWSAALVVPSDAGVIGVPGNATLSPAAGGSGGLPSGKSGQSVTLFRY